MCIFLFHRRFGWRNETEREKNTKIIFENHICWNFNNSESRNPILHYYYYIRIHESRSKYGSLFIQNENALTRYNIGFALITFSFLSDGGIKRQYIYYL